MVERARPRKRGGTVAASRRVVVARVMRIPDRGWPEDRVFAALEALRVHDMPWRDGRTWAYVYDPGPEAEAVLKRAFGMFLSENALDPTVFPSVLALETQVVAMAAAHLGGDDQVVGNFTSGGTESIILAANPAISAVEAKSSAARSASVSALKRCSATITPTGSPRCATVIRA